MKRFNWLLVGLVVLCLAVTSLTGCVAKSEYEALQAKHATLLQEKASLTQENTSLKAELEGVQSDLTNLQAEHDTLKTNYHALKADYDELSADYEAANKELAEIKEVYPPRYFSGYDELEDWVDEHCPITYSTYNVLKKHLELQEKALADGYVWSVYTESEGKGIISCVVAGDSVYWVWLDGYIEWVYWR